MRFVAGADVAFDKPNGRAVGAVVVLAYPSLEVVEQVTVEDAGHVPVRARAAVVPRDAGAARGVRAAAAPARPADGRWPRLRASAAVRLRVPPRAAARRADDRRREVAADRRAGTVAGPRGSRADLTDGGEVIGSMLRTRQGVRSIYVSVGHRIGLAAAERWVLACATRLPRARADAAGRPAGRRGEAPHARRDARDRSSSSARASRGAGSGCRSERASRLPARPASRWSTHYGCSRRTS